jgi:hypothetical protein
MPALDEVLQLEKEISDISHGIVSSQAQLQAVNRNLSAARTKVEAERHGYTVARASLMHMRKVADHVVLQEYLQVNRTAERKLEALEVARLALAKAENRKRMLERDLAALETARSERAARLKSYGKVLDMSQASKPE